MKESLFAQGTVTIVGVLNLTPDSFSDGGRFIAHSERLQLAAAVAAGLELVAQGAQILDLGGESTRPGAEELPDDEEIARTQPVVEALVEAGVQVPLSIDTRKAAVAAAAVEAGASVINDVSGLAFDPALAEIAASSQSTLILGHMRGTPKEMQRAPYYDDVLREVSSELAHSVACARRAGVDDTQLAVDPGIGFGKRLEDNLQLMVHAAWLREQLRLPVMLGPSRKRFLGTITGEPVERRDPATHAACAVAAFAGVDALRVHDVVGASRAAAIGLALRRARRKELS